MSFRISLTVGLVLGWWIALAPLPTRAQVQPKAPQVVYPQGSIEAIRQGMVKIATTGGESWMVHIPPTAEIMVTGTATPDFLKPELCIEFLADVNRHGRVQNKIEKLGIFTPSELKFLGAFAEAGFDNGPNDAGQRGKRPTSRYKVHGRITSMKNDKLTVDYRTGTVEIELADEVKIDLAVADYRFAKPGDKISCTGIQVGEKAAQATRVSIDMAQPLSGMAKKSRRPKPPRKQNTAETSDEERKLSEKLTTLLTPKDDTTTGEAFRIEGDPTEFRPSVRGPAPTLRKRFGRPKTTTVKGLWTSGEPVRRETGPVATVDLGLRQSGRRQVEESPILRRRVETGEVGCVLARTFRQPGP